MKSALIAAVALVMLPGCGHTETEWKAQLAKSNQLISQLVAEKETRTGTEIQLKAAKMKVSTLEEKLKQLGYELNSVSAELQQTDTENDRLESSVDKLKRALNEYKLRAERLDRIKQNFEVLRDKLKQLTQLGLKVEVRNNRMVIRLPGDVLFSLGSDKLKPAGMKVLVAVADVIRNDPQLSKRYFQIAGHTDNVPLMGGVFRDNWGLSLMRAREVLLYLIAPTNSPKGGGGLDALRLHAAGYGEVDPVNPNSDSEKRNANRRVELVIMPDVEEMLDLRQLI